MRSPSKGRFKKEKKGPETLQCLGVSKVRRKKPRRYRKGPERYTKIRDHSSQVR